MIVYLGADHRGYELKEKMKYFLESKSYKVIDLGNTAYDATDDYPDFAKLVGEKISANPEYDRGVLFCGSGAGVVVTANKFKGIRAATVFSIKHVKMIRGDEDINIIGIPSDYLDSTTVKEIVIAFLETPFSTEERHHRRVDKISKLEG